MKFRFSVFQIIVAASAILFILALAPQRRAVAQQVGPLYCSQNAQYDASTTGSTRFFTANATSPRQVYICGYQINVGATATNVQLKSGTGTNCGTGTANITPNFVLPIAGRMDDASPAWRGLLVPAGQDICIVASGANAVQAIIFYTYQ